MEKGVDSEVPIVVTNVDQIYLSYHLLTPQGWTDQKHQVLPVPQVKDIGFKMPFGIRDFTGTGTGSGIVQGDFTTNPDVNNKNASWYNWFFSQITPYYVQAKLGHHSPRVDKPIDENEVDLGKPAFCITAIMCYKIPVVI